MFLTKKSGIPTHSIGGDRILKKKAGIPPYLVEKLEFQVFKGKKVLNSKGGDRIL